MYVPKNINKVKGNCKRSYVLSISEVFTETPDTEKVI